VNALGRDLHFTKMHGLGNDFVVLDLRDTSDPHPGLCRFLADRHQGVGCDLILGIAAPRKSGSIASYRIWTSSGLASRQCGNGARCIAAWTVRAGIAVTDRFTLDSPSGTHMVDKIGPDRFRVSLGVPDFSLSAPPLRGFGQSQDGHSVSFYGLPPLTFDTVLIGNPHIVLEVEDITTAPVATLGPCIRDAPGLPDGVNVGFVQFVSPTHIRLRVDEFGAGETLACGSGACAAAATLMRRGRIARHVTVSLAGGDLAVNWPDSTAEITMAGPATFAFEGSVPASIAATLEGAVADPSTQDLHIF